MNSFGPHHRSRVSTTFPRPRNRRATAAHTLVEVLLALGLSLVILVAVYGALDQHWRYAEAGQRQTEQMQVRRALFERIALDLRSVLFRPAAMMQFAERGGEVRRIEVIQSGDVYGGRGVGVLGDAQTLVVHRYSPNIDGNHNSRTVRWQVANVESKPRDGISTVSQSTSKAARNDANTSTTTAALNAAHRSGPAGLARIVADANISVSLGDGQKATAKELLAEEVDSVRFRYYSRGSWFDQWDSVARRELPQAVEVTIGFRRPASTDRDTNRRTKSKEARLIIPIPASEA